MARRNVAYGFVQAPGLADLMRPLGAPDTWTDEDKRTVNELVERANEVAQASKGADTGTAVHRLTELADLGLPVSAGPYAPDLEAYRTTLERAGLEVVEVECRLVCDELRMAGTADRIVRDTSGRYRILDLKTGATVDYGALGWAAQLAAYAHSELYNTSTDERRPTPLLDKMAGLVCHLPAGRGICNLYEVDLMAGYRAAELANEIRAVRNASRRWLTPLPGTLDPELASVGELVEPVSEPPAPVPAPLSRRELHDELGRDHDEGATVAPERVERLRARHDELDPALQMWAGSLEADARRHGVGFRLKGQPTERRLRLYGALVILAAAEVTDEEFLRALVARARGDELAFLMENGGEETDGEPVYRLGLGHLIGAMDATTARRFLHEAGELEAGRLVCMYPADGGAMRLHETATV